MVTRDHMCLVFTSRYCNLTPACQLQILALDDIRNEIIGDEEVRGISGGQRKRVNVGLELVADPVMLFLDEPTSGLDSTSSKMVISALQEVSTCLQRPPGTPPTARASSLS